ncbi:MAG: hypothetical protein ACFFEF_10510 [Candidatus Thorarchaeota archaeon]
MKILNIEIQNFKPFKSLSLPEQGELPDGLILIKGPNSTGKSSLFEAILWSIWGPSGLTGTNQTNDDLVSFASSFCKVTLIFEVSKSRYKIERSYDSATGMNVILYTWMNGSWKRTADKTRTVETEVESILNISSTQALNTLLVRQGEVALIANATPSVLREMLVEVYNLNLLEKMTDHLGSLESDLTIQIDALERGYTNPDYIEKQIKLAQESIKNQNNQLAEKEKQVNEAENALKKLPDSQMFEQLNDLTQETDRKRNDIERITKTRDSELKTAAILSADEELILARMSSLEKQSEKIDGSEESAKEKLSEIDFEVGSLIGEGTRLQKAAETLESSEDEVKCPTCSKPISPEERNRIVKEYQTTIKTALKRADELKNQRSLLAEKIREYGDKKIEISRVIEAINRAIAFQKEIDHTHDLLKQAQSKLNETLAKAGIKNIQTILKKFNAKDIAELHRILVGEQKKFESFKGEYEIIQKSINDEEERLSQLGDDVVAMKQLGAEILNLKSLLEHTQYVRRKLVSGFLADYVIQKRLIGIIKGATNPYVRSFTNGQYSGIDLIPTKAKGRGGAGLELKIQDKRDDAVKKTTQLSYGDRTAVSLGLRLGISRTMSAIRPLKDSPALSPRIRCVLLDEPLGGLDKNRRTSVVQNLINDQSFQQILLITHTDVQSWQGVPVIEVSKTGSTSEAVLQINSEE